MLPCQGTQTGEGKEMSPVMSLKDGGLFNLALTSLRQDLNLEIAVC